MLSYENDLNSFIWVKISIKSKRPILFGGGYRQFALPSEMGLTDSRKNKNQIDRFKTLLEAWETALKSNFDTIVAMDSNIDFYPLTKHHENYLDKKLYDIFQEFISDNKLTVHNNQFTRYQSNCDPSIIDQIISNCPQKIINMRTELNSISDHCHLSSLFNIEIPNQQPRYKRVKNFKGINRESLTEALKVNQHFQEVFHQTDPNIIAEIIMQNLNQIIDILAPLRIVQIKKDYLP